MASKIISDILEQYLPNDLINVVFSFADLTVSDYIIEHGEIIRGYWKYDYSWDFFNKKQNIITHDNIDDLVKNNFIQCKKELGNKKDFKINWTYKICIKIPKTNKKAKKN